MLREMAAGFLELSPSALMPSWVLAGETIDTWVAGPGVTSRECLSTVPGVSWSLAPPWDSEMRREGDRTSARVPLTRRRNCSSGCGDWLGCVPSRGPARVEGDTVVQVTSQWMPVEDTHR